MSQTYIVRHAAKMFQLRTEVPGVSDQLNVFTCPCHHGQKMSESRKKENLNLVQNYNNYELGSNDIMTTICSYFA